MDSVPELSKIVSLIMQNPDLIKEISSLASAESEKTPTEPVNEDEEVSSKPVETAVKENVRSHRRELLMAMRPYLSESRRSALDSMASILDIIDVVSHK